MERSGKLGLDSELIIGKDKVLEIGSKDLDDFYVSASDIDRMSLFFILLTSLHYYEENGEDVEALKAFCEKIQERRNRAAEIADDIFPIDFHIYEIKWSENDRMRIGVETVWQVLDGSFSGDKKTRKQLEKLFKRLYLYYGVTAEDIKNETERYKSLLGVLCS